MSPLCIRVFRVSYYFLLLERNSYNLHSLHPRSSTLIYLSDATAGRFSLPCTFLIFHSISTMTQSPSLHMDSYSMSSIYPNSLVLCPSSLLEALLTHISYFLLFQHFDLPAFHLLTFLLFQISLY